MRRKDREVTDFNDKIEIVKACKVCHIAMFNGDAPYIVPVNFGYEADGDALTIYLHCALRGLKVDCLRQNPNVCVEMDCEHELIYSEIGCKNGFKFVSIIGMGKAEFIADIAEKQKALTLLMQHQTGERFEFTELQTRAVEVLKVRLESFTGKRRAM